MEVHKHAPVTNLGGAAPARQPLKGVMTMIHRLSILLIVIVLLAACGNAPAAVAPTAVPAPTGAATAPAEPVTGLEGTTRPFTDDLGRVVQLPIRPQRVVILDPSIHISHMLSVGLVPVGATLNPTIEGGQRFSSLWGEAANQITSVGEVGQPDLEKIASLNPDLILYALPYSEQNLDVLSAIAPVVAYEMTTRPGTEDSLRWIGQVLNREQEAEAAIAQFNELLTATRATLNWEGKTIAVASLYPDEARFTLFGPGSRIGDVVTKLGATLVPQTFNGEPTKPYTSDVSAEVVAQTLQSDLLILLRYQSGDTSDQILDTWLNSPLWQQLPAVQADQYVVLDVQEGNANLGLAGLTKALNEIQQRLTMASAAPAAPAFPVTIEHKYGTTTIPSQPQRVIALGYNDQDPILALGVQPVGVRYWFGEPENGVWPWAQTALGAAVPEVLNMPFGELNLEAIAALQPDLIIAVSAGITAEEYQVLSQIAPTLAQSAAYVDFGVPWQEQTRVIGQALGATAQAEELVAATEARFAALKEQYPAFNGATAVIAAPASDGQFFFSGLQHERQRVLTTLGFVLPEELATIAGEAFYGTISGERLPLFDTDLLIWTASTAERAQIEANPIYQQLNVVKEGRVIWLDTTGEGELVGPALVYSSVLSLPIVFDELVPQLAIAVDGDPATVGQR
jgi:iron complex transport system substrate-binding protein